MTDLIMPGPFNPLSLEKLFTLQLPEVDFLVDEILPTGSACLLSAREKAGKGLMAIDLCASVALGEPFLDRSVQQGVAIYCAAEEHIRDVRARIALRLGQRRDAPLKVLPLDGSTGDRLWLDDGDSMQRLWDMVEEIKPVLVVLDPMRELHERQEDVADEMGPLLRPIRQLAHLLHTTVMVSHHHNKLGGFRGSTAIRAAFDLEWSFTQRSGESDAEESLQGTLRIEGRHGPRTVIPIQLGEYLRWEVDRNDITLREPSTRARILTMLDASLQSLTAEQIATQAKINQKTVQNVLSTLVRETPSPLLVEGAGTKSDAYRYRMIPPV